MLFRIRMYVGKCSRCGLDVGRYFDRSLWPSVLFPMIVATGCTLGRSLWVWPIALVVSWAAFWIIAVVVGRLYHVLTSSPCPRCGNPNWRLELENPKKRIEVTGKPKRSWLSEAPRPAVYFVYIVVGVVGVWVSHIR
jgi:hypothetical protein